MGKILFTLPYIIHQDFLALLSGVVDKNLKGNLNQITVPNKFGILIGLNINQEYNFDSFILFT